MRYFDICCGCCQMARHTADTGRETISTLLPRTLVVQCPLSFSVPCPPALCVRRRRGPIADMACLAAAALQLPVRFTRGPRQQVQTGQTTTEDRISTGVIVGIVPVPHRSHHQAAAIRREQQ